MSHKIPFSSIIYLFKIIALPIKLKFFSLHLHFLISMLNFLHLKRIPVHILIITVDLDQYIFMLFFIYYLVTKEFVTNLTVNILLIKRPRCCKLIKNLIIENFEKLINSLLK